MFSEETDWCYRFRQAGWHVLFTPEAEFVHVGGATTRQNWGPCSASRCVVTCGSSRSTAARRRPSARAGCCWSRSASARSRFPGDRGRTYKEAARWLAASPTLELLEARG